MWWQVELREAENLAEFHFYSEESGGGGRGRGAPPPSAFQTSAPRGYRVQLSMDGTTWSEPVAEGRANSTMNAITWTPRSARFLRITQTAASPGLPPWEMFNAKLYARRGARQ
jgi:hypothetical protein